MGLSAWKQFGSSRWALRVNPSSGNLHPTETYVVWEGRVCHYAPREHALEERRTVNDRRTIKVRPAGAVRPDPAGAVRPDPAGDVRADLADDVWPDPADAVRRGPLWPADDAFLVALTSIHWREAWKYGERAFRYCQHDVGHAIGALRLSAQRLGWQLTILPRWSDAQIAALLGLDRDADYGDAEREAPDCLAVVTAADVEAWRQRDPAPIVAAARDGAWHGRANRLSADRVEWPIIDDVAAATRYEGGAGEARRAGDAGGASGARRASEAGGASGARRAGEAGGVDEQFPTHPTSPTHPTRPHYPRDLLLQRRSATAFDTRYGLRRDTFLSMLAALQPDAPPFDAIDGPPHVHLALFVHRVDGLTPGVYAWLRDPAVLEEWRAAMRPDFLWEQPAPGVPLYLLVPIDCRRIANRLSCDQDIAGDGFFSLGMIARFEAPLRERGAWCYRRLFWECGLIGQVLYLEAEAATVRATGIGCYYDEPVHEALGLSGHAWQSLYHLAVGMPVEDTRLTTEPGYAWES